MSTDIQQQDKREFRVVFRAFNQRFKRYITRDHEEDIRKVVFELNFAFVLAATLLYLVSRSPG